MKLLTVSELKFVSGSENCKCYADFGNWEVEARSLEQCEDYCCDYGSEGYLYGLNSRGFDRHIPSPLGYAKILDDNYYQCIPRRRTFCLTGVMDLINKQGIGGRLSVL
jgi:hypothetical protein